MTRKLRSKRLFRGPGLLRTNYSLRNEGLTLIGNMVEPEIKWVWRGKGWGWEIESRKE